MIMDLPEMSLYCCLIYFSPRPVEVARVSLGQRLLLTMTLLGVVCILIASGLAGLTALCLVAFSMSSWTQHGITDRDRDSAGMSTETLRPSGKRTHRRSMYFDTKDILSC